MLGRLCGEPLYFYDAIAPIVDADSIEWDDAFRAPLEPRRTARRGRRRRRGLPQLPLDARSTRRSSRRCAPAARCAALLRGGRYFEGCLPIEVMAERGATAGLRADEARGPERSAHRPPPTPWCSCARGRNRTAYNLVGFQTRLAYPEQQRIFRMIPGLARRVPALGSIHRTLHRLAAPAGPELELRSRPDVRFAGQITGVEGYIESTAMGLLAAAVCAGELTGRAASPPPPTTSGMGGALSPRHPRRAKATTKYGPTNVNYGLLPPLPGPAVEARPPAAVRLARPGRVLRLVRRGRLTGPCLRPRRPLRVLKRSPWHVADVPGVVCTRHGRPGRCLLVGGGGRARVHQAEHGLQAWRARH